MSFNSSTTQIDFFQKRQQHFETLQAQTQAQYNQWAVARAIYFIAWGGLSYWAFEALSPWIFLGILVVGFGVFLWMINKHLAIKAQKLRYQLLTNLNEDEALRLQGKFVRQETGEVYIKAQHFYASDLDIFGKHSIFKLLNRTRTYTGAEVLADWLQSPADHATILTRQESSSELKDMIDWRQNLEVDAWQIEDVHQPITPILEWLQLAPFEVLKQKSLRYLLYLPYLSIPVVLACILDILPLQWILAVFIIHGFILRKVSGLLGLYLDKTSSVANVLKAYANLCKSIAVPAFQHAHLQRLQTEVNQATAHIQELSVLLERIGNRQNPIFALSVGMLTLWDLRYFIHLENWRAQHQNHLAHWIAIVSEFEALSSVAGHSFANPSHVIPQIANKDFIIHATQLGHPLIKSEKRVCNDIQIEGLGQCVIITGSNMSGKSTFQRTVALNTILALAGSVVCAQQFECSVMQVFTSMRTQDSLEEDTSSFYAELKRLKQLIDWVNEKQSLPTFYFLDEILKGTNSKDRHDGAKALMLQLHQAQASGFISTHDVDLGDEFSEKGFVKNFSFSSEVREGKLVFDYTLKQGICRSFNASQLMAQIGIKM
ncbi:MutS-related protein [Flectobacillus roseus]|uniref:DNA mismatch repair protein MutS n=1 Tax=Flectobacillus roseus TaxID=502259 RepID=A0ABT6Y9M1_9BACT|nr:DNA mismatch repair protein MutS [Flectobacillus roseus]MDI9860272.1 DNA mismatch repair protein MutS [Flectobacillus roseus]